MRRCRIRFQIQRPGDVFAEQIAVMVVEGRYIDEQPLSQQLPVSQFGSVHLLRAEMPVRIEPCKLRQSVRSDPEKSRQKEITLGVRRSAHRMRERCPKCLLVSRRIHQSRARLQLQRTEVRLQKFCTQRKRKLLVDDRNLILQKSRKQSVRSLRGLERESGDDLKIVPAAQACSQSPR